MENKIAAVNKVKQRSRRDLKVTLRFSLKLNLILMSLGVGCALDVYAQCILYGLEFITFAC